MPSYTVRWEIDVEAEDVEQAVYKARFAQGRDTTATTFEVDGELYDTDELTRRVLSLPLDREVFTEDEIMLIGGSGQQDENVAALIEEHGFELPDDFSREARWVAELVEDVEERLDVLKYLIWLACGEFNDDVTRTSIF